MKMFTYKIKNQKCWIQYQITIEDIETTWKPYKIQNFTSPFFKSFYLYTFLFKIKHSLTNVTIKDFKVQPQYF
jgi:hypothetical protein